MFQMNDEEVFQDKVFYGFLGLFAAVTSAVMYLTVA